MCTAHRKHVLKRTDRGPTTQTCTHCKSQVGILVHASNFGSCLANPLLLWASVQSRLPTLSWAILPQIQSSSSQLSSAASYLTPNMIGGLHTYPSWGFSLCSLFTSILSLHWSWCGPEHSYPDNRQRLPDRSWASDHLAQHLDECNHGENTGQKKDKISKR